MRISALTPTYAPLPFGSVMPSDTAGARVLPPDMASPEAVARFDAILHEINPDALRVDQPRLEGLAAALMAMPPDTAREAFDQRLRQIETFRAMLADPDWDADDGMRARVGKLLEYCDRDDGLIPNATPVLGLLDDVLLLELAWPVFEQEVEEYRDFCDYRHDEHPTGDAAVQRAAWLRDRLAELALLRHHARVSDSHYIEGRIPPTPFRVGGG